MPNAQCGEQTAEWLAMLEVQASLLRNEFSTRRRLERRLQIAESDVVERIEGLLASATFDAGEVQHFLSILWELCYAACLERAETAPQSSDWDKFTGEILGYAKFLARLEERKTE